MINFKKLFRRKDKASEFEKRHSELKKELSELHKAKQIIKERQREIEKELQKGRRL